jgi:hypothetical protein
LLEIDDLKMSQEYREVVLNRQSLLDIIKLVLYLTMNHENKDEFVTRILELEEDTQIHLMEEIKKVQHSLQNNVEIKEIFSKI